MHSLDLRRKQELLRDEIRGHLTLNVDADRQLSGGPAVLHLLSQLPADVDDRLVVDLRWFGMTDPGPNNLVKFEDDLNDMFGMPQPTFEFTLSETDRMRAHEMMSDMVDAALALGGFLPSSEPRFLPARSSLHLDGHLSFHIHDVGPPSTAWTIGSGRKGRARPRSAAGRKDGAYGAPAK